MTHVITCMSTNLVFVNDIIVKKNMVGTFLTKIADHRHLNLKFLELKDLLNKISISLFTNIYTSTIRCKICLRVWFGIDWDFDSLHLQCKKRKLHSCMACLTIIHILVVISVFSLLIAVILMDFMKPNVYNLLIRLCLLILIYSWNEAAFCKALMITFKN